ncbi:class I SAM-dependent methyltransferase [Nocardioides campestrisoli]|uniref:class I SAM-dependent methyltransferase n=1 Tax=Nocardioides campestrisoli TaxID=2736757 RepID=UPI001C632970|nr:class I SAM-dependent methyltransferase [Nocardioides campestrisoli]
MQTQPGYDALASAYDEAFPTGYATLVERHVVALFAEELLADGPAGPVVDLGCGAGHITHDLDRRGLDVLGVDPSTGMLDLARRRYPQLRWHRDDAALGRLPVDLSPLAGILARFSLIHVPPETVPEVLAAWAARLRPGAHVLVAFQVSEDPGSPVLEFDHAVARAWRWHPDAMAAALAEAGLSERWRLVSQPDDSNRFSTCHLACRLA